uniref:Uncharacterized protein n=1 Tax=Heterorhabditis bacteriophora TaxID=37862 RepID=A0A1I7WIM2_HETBA
MDVESNTSIKKVLYVIVPFYSFIILQIYLTDNIGLRATSVPLPYSVFLKYGNYILHRNESRKVVKVALLLLKETGSFLYI